MCLCPCLGSGTPTTPGNTGELQGRASPRSLESQSEGGQRGWDKFMMRVSRLAWGWWPGTEVKLEMSSTQCGSLLWEAPLSPSLWLSLAKQDPVWVRGRTKHPPLQAGLQSKEAQRRASDAGLSFPEVRRFIYWIVIPVAIMTMYWTFTVYQELSLCLYIYRYNIQNKHKKYINIQYKIYVLLNIYAIYIYTQYNKIHTMWYKVGIYDLAYLYIWLK